MTNSLLFFLKNYCVFMDEEKINISVRKFLKNVGITSQRKIEEKIRDNSPNSTKKIKISAHLVSDELDLNEKIEGEIDIEI